MRSRAVSSAAVLVFDPHGAAGLKRLALHGLEIGEVARRPPPAAAPASACCEPLGQLGSP